MPSFLMPADSNKELHLKLLDLLDDAKLQFDSMCALAIPDKIKIKAQKEYTECLEKYEGLPIRDDILKITNDKTENSVNYRSVCTRQYFKFATFYGALEILLARHYSACQSDERNKYLIEALAKIPESRKLEIKAMPESPRMRPSPRTPRDDETASKEPESASPRKRGLSHTIMPTFWIASHKTSESNTEALKEATPRHF